jgi:P2-related tail formation protein
MKKKKKKTISEIINKETKKKTKKKTIKGIQTVYVLLFNQLSGYNLGYNQLASLSHMLQWMNVLSTIILCVSK